MFNWYSAVYWTVHSSLFVQESTKYSIFLAGHDFLKHCTSLELKVFLFCSYSFNSPPHLSPSWNALNELLSIGRPYTDECFCKLFAFSCSKNRTTHCLNPKAPFCLITLQCTFIMKPISHLDLRRQHDCLREWYICSIC